MLSIAFITLSGSSTLYKLLKPLELLSKCSLTLEPAIISLTATKAVETLELINLLHFTQWSHEVFNLPTLFTHDFPTHKNTHTHTEIHTHLYLGIHFPPAYDNKNCQRVNKIMRILCESFSELNFHREREPIIAPSSSCCCCWRLQLAITELCFAAGYHPTLANWRRWINTRGTQTTTTTIQASSSSCLCPFPTSTWPQAKSESEWGGTECVAGG